MVRVTTIAVLTLALAGCKQPAAKARITQFKVTPSFLPTGISGKLCYGVENAAKLELNPRVEDLLPASDRCIDITPARTTTYTLTAYGADSAPGNEDKKSVEVRVGAPPPRLSDLAASSTNIKRGASVRVCFKVENAKSVSAKPGRLDRKTNCLVDYPRKTTTYKISAFGPDSGQDSGTVTVKVRR
jgi:hypothetical protein